MSDLTPDKLDQIEKAATRLSSARLGHALRECPAIELGAAQWVFDDVVASETVTALVARVRELEAQVERAREVHEREDIAEHPGYGMESRCLTCMVHWPCDTIAALKDSQ